MSRLTPCPELPALIDHALLKPTLSQAELEAGCALARRWSVASVCVVPSGLAATTRLLAGSNVRPTTTIGFPHGCQTSATKRAEAREALSVGAVELDMVVNLGWVLDGRYANVREEVRDILREVREVDRKLKVIFENAYLDTSHKLALCDLCAELNVDWVKTSTGFGPSGATPNDVRLMRERVPQSVQVKASGGIRTLEDALAMVALGVTRIGTSSTEAILAEWRAKNPVG